MTSLPPAQTPSRKRAGPIMIIAAVILLAILGGWVLTPKVTAMMGARSATPSGVETEEVPSPPPAEAMVLENLIANPAGSEGMRYLIVTMAVESATQADDEVLRAKEGRVRDLALGVMGLYRAEWLAGTPQRDSLKVMLSDTLARTFDLTAAPDVYFPQYVIQ